MNMIYILGLLFFMVSFCQCTGPNFVIILTDDQDLLLNGMRPMLNTIALVATKGKTFQNAFVNTPICCPSRSTILTGKFGHNTGVVNNSISGNCSSPSWQQTHEPHSIAAILKNSTKYITYYSGKYLNEVEELKKPFQKFTPQMKRPTAKVPISNFYQKWYGSEGAGGIQHIPKGYDWWIGLKGNSVYYNYTLSINGTGRFFSDKYLTDALAGYSLTFLDEKPPERPFFMIVAPPAPHAPFTPAKRHGNAFAGVKAVRSPSFNKSGLDKHWLIRMPPEHLPENVNILDQIQEHRLESLLAVDELVEKVINKLKSLDLLEKTYVLFTSDNGFHIGQFSQPWDKRQPYETDIRVPFIISGPNVPIKTLETFPISTVDIAPTILDLAGVAVPKDMDGVSFKERLFAEKAEPFAKTVLIEYWGEGNENRIDQRCPWKYDPNMTQCTVDQWCKCQDSKNNTYSCIVELSESRTFKLCQFYDEEHFLEAYNVTVDPFELKNIANKLSFGTVEDYLEILTQFQKCSGRNCQDAKIRKLNKNYIIPFV